MRARVRFERCTVTAFASGQGARRCRYTYKCIYVHARAHSTIHTQRTHTTRHRQRWPCGHSRVLVPPSIYVDTLKAAFTTDVVRRVKLLNARSRPRSPGMDVAGSPRRFNCQLRPRIKFKLFCGSVRHYSRHRNTCNSTAIRFFPRLWNHDCVFLPASALRNSARTLPHLYIVFQINYLIRDKII